MLRREIANCLFVAFGLTWLGGCGDSPGQAVKPDVPKPSRSRSSEVVVYSPHGQEMIDEYEKAFESSHPDIDLIGRFVPTGQILSQLQIDKGSPQIDVWWGGTTAFFSQAQEAGLLAPYKPTWADASLPGYHDPNHFWYAQFLQVPAIMFNANIYAPDQIPSTWDELLGPKWKDKIVIREPLDSGTMKTILTGIIWQRGGAQGNPHPGYDFLKKLDAQTRSYLPNPQALYDRIAKSEAGYITLWNLTDVIFQREANRYPFGGKVPKGPVPVSLDPIALIAHGPNPKEAKLFYEFITSKENDLKMARDHFRILARSDIRPEELPPILRQIQFEPMAIDQKKFDELQVEWMKHWQSSIRDPGK